MVKKFHIHLSEAHNKTGLTSYAVWKEVKKKINISKTTVRRYATEENVILDHLPSTALALMEFYGVDWRDPNIVEVIDET
jgi:hypothetical protein